MFKTTTFNSLGTLGRGKFNDSDNQIGVLLTAIAVAGGLICFHFTLSQIRKNQFNEKQN